MILTIHFAISCLKKIISIQTNCSILSTFVSAKELDRNEADILQWIIEGVDNCFIYHHDDNDYYRITNYSNTIEDAWNKHWRAELMALITLIFQIDKHPIMVLIWRNKNSRFELFLLVSKFFYLRSWCPKFPCFSNLINKNRIKFAF